MGIFSRARASRVSEWRTDEHGVRTFGGEIGGDIQRGDAYIVRYIRDDMPGSMITVSFYAAEYDRNPGEFLVQRQVEWLVCEDPADPGGTEIWSDVEYSDVTGIVIDAEVRAEESARDFAEIALGAAWTHGWDGQPDLDREAGG